MKKLLLGCLLAACVCTGLYAEPTEDEQFQILYNEMKKESGGQEGMTVVADTKYRIIYIALPIPMKKSDVTAEFINNGKKQLVNSLSSETAGGKLIKQLKITVVYTFVTTDKDSFTIAVTPSDL